MRFWAGRRIILRKVIADWYKENHKPRFRVGILVDRFIKMDKVLLEDIYNKYITNEEKREIFKKEFLLD